MYELILEKKIIYRNLCVGTSMYLTIYLNQWGSNNDQYDYDDDYVIVLLGGIVRGYPNEIWLYSHY